MNATEEEDFAEFARARWTPLMRLARTLALDEARAEDLVQEALIRMWRVWPRVRLEHPDAYARRTLVNVAMSWRRRKWWGETAVAYIADRPRDAVEGPAAATADRDLLRRAVAQLPYKQRIVVLLRYVEDLSEQQVAELMGCSAGTVKSQASRGLARLRKLPAFARAEAEDGPAPRGARAHGSAFAN
ncbi:SigE family RNA polymerase sigma factor [Yinghuangia seranimata]|uniref:SigE family RNA polymerase sigma factor n=1 Tax=Yinghuangia seranimata TaxID=408067 RepID=UPI00248AB741|nr:SigE family RNA polymerase sigma factor [Yinghuangia seranimata]MDI2131463.1 SigE family RNA polymerase sigma factor [Yinghuangia seranimata]